MKGNILEKSLHLLQRSSSSARSYKTGSNSFWNRIYIFTILTPNSQDMQWHLIKILTQFKIFCEIIQNTEVQVVKSKMSIPNTHCSVLIIYSVKINYLLLMISSTTDIVMKLYLF